jgi:hypothetical protein
MASASSLSFPSSSRQRKEGEREEKGMEEREAADGMRGWLAGGALAKKQRGAGTADCSEKDDAGCAGRNQASGVYCNAFSCAMQGLLFSSESREDSNDVLMPEEDR